MKKEREYILSLICLVVALIGLLFTLRFMITFGFDNLGESATNLAKVLAASIEITDEDVEELLKIDFDELLDNPTNKKMETILEKSDLGDSIEFVYVVKKLYEDNVRYTIDDMIMSDFFGMEIGTDLDYIWLLDYIVNDNERMEAYSDPAYFNDIYRYTKIDKATETLYKKQKSDYFLKKDEWGQTITGFAPMYTVEGTYIGLLGVDIYADEYFQYRHNIIIAVIAMFIFLSMILIAIFTVRYVRFKNFIQKDNTTGLYQKTNYEKYANNYLKKVRTSSNSFTIIMIGVDDFKLFSDFYGKSKSDSLLSAISKILLEEIEGFSSFAGRYSDEEFIAFVQNISEKDGDALCERVRQRVRGLNIAHEKREYQKVATVSIGVFTVTKFHNSLNLEQLIELTYGALNRATSKGKNKVVRQNSVDINFNSL